MSLDPPAKTALADLDVWAFFAEASAAFTAALRASTSSRADASSRRRVFASLALLFQR